MAGVMAMCHHSRMAAPSTTGSATDPDLEGQVVEEGKRLLAAARSEAEGARLVDQWLERLLERVMEDEGFRVQALRFVDVLPALDDDRELTRHLHEYFGEEGFPLPRSSPSACATCRPGSPPVSWRAPSASPWVA